MAITMMRELRKSLADNLGPDDVISSVKALHMAPTGVDGLAGDETYCGKPTADMERTGYQPGEADRLWLPPHMSSWECRTCGDALRPL
ncbi:hypothetical protein ACFWFU_03280 [Streptomyces sp. NPDC060235]|uniref:hypothetical protein n=1 Tax=unclassified Streptomyces TaxID=2593676 RepID=UPI00365314A4